MKTLGSSPKYTSFIRDRNRALEQVQRHTQTDISRMLSEVLDRISGFVSHMAIQEEMSLNQLSFLTQQLSSYLDYQFQPLAHQIERRLIRMRKNTFVLTYLAELEAIARATQRTKSLTSMDFKAKIQTQLKKDLITNQSWSKRIWIAFTRIKHDIVNDFQLAISQDQSPKEVVDAVKKAYPKRVFYKKPPRALKVVREADHSKKDEDQEFHFYSGLTNDEDWDQAVQAYKSTELPPSRFEEPNDPNYSQYDWELERDVTDDFVSQVRDGQVEAATDLGVKDFVWVAVLDKKTCEVCCEPRNGKTTSEIESMLSSGELSADDCDATVPPAHPYCRCDIAPVASTDEVEGPDWKSFQDWLES